MCSYERGIRGIWKWIQKEGLVSLRSMVLEVVKGRRLGLDELTVNGDGVDS